MVLRSTMQSIPRFSQDARADTAVKNILLKLFRIIETNEARILERGSPVAIHRFRVAVRRSRSLLSFSHGILPESRIRVARKSLAWVMADSNAIRDRQVMQGKLKAIQAELPGPCGKTFLAYRRYLQAEIEAELRHLQKQLQSKRYLHFKKTWLDYLLEKPPQRSGLSHAAVPIAQVSNQMIERAWSRVLEKGSHIKIRSPADEIHKLRIACKKYRYCVEFFTAPERAEQELLALESLQDSLGVFQDISVQHGLVEAALQTSALDPGCLQALQNLLNTQEQLTRRQAVNEFHRFRQSRRHRVR
jgi:CHAD domain-containing protein